MREFALSVPEIVRLSVMTPYPGTEIWHTQSQELASRDYYRLFDIQHAVLPTKLPLAKFYEELVRTQSVINRKHLGLAALAKAARVVGRQLARGQTNFARCCGGSTRSTTLGVSWPTTNARSSISFRSPSTATWRRVTAPICTSTRDPCAGTRPPA